ncbi:hypothetical protein J2Y38_000708 [Flavobacterium sp. 2755]|uniref:hypothetical protein n=1 Tax=Flavobacterium sp. 2755 TaxID=2817765 RepID=UPI0028573AB5|nr:hypothetical protein [Flavobacterium sp. 2755]MDR6760529.1 hypothetical protein [Flavobacterium sp. 2755]
MKKVILSLIIILTLSAGGYLFYTFKRNNKEKKNLSTLSIEELTSNVKKNHKTLSPKDLDPKSFILLFKEKYNKKSPLNFVSMLGDFPENWVQPKDVEYLISVMNSKEKCCGYMNLFSSTLLTEDAEVGGFAIIFLNSYISHTKIDLGSNSNPKVDKESIKKIEDWYRNTKK